MIPQWGDDFPNRLANAHADAATRYPGLPVLQIGMDTPQVDGPALESAVERLAGYDAVLGPAMDGGWWALGLRDPRAADVLRAVATSRSDTGARTRLALAEAGLRVGTLPTLSDVDVVEDARLVAAQAPGGRFAAAVAHLPMVSPR